jgi:hypothetical protein
MTALDYRRGTGEEIPEIFSTSQNITDESMSFIVNQSLPRENRDTEFM